MAEIIGPEILNKLPIDELDKALKARSGSEFLDIVLNDKAKTATKANIEEEKEIEAKKQELDPSIVAEQKDLLVKGAQYINERIAFLKNKVKAAREGKNSKETREDNKPKETIMGMEVEELEFAGEKYIQDHTNSELAKKKSACILKIALANATKLAGRVIVGTDDYFETKEGICNALKQLRSDDWLYTDGTLQYIEDISKNQLDKMAYQGNYHQGCFHHYFLVLVEHHVIRCYRTNNSHF
jgi:hypothetical protein